MNMFLRTCRGLEMGYATFLMILALRKAAIIWKETAGLKGINLAKVLIRDQAVYFIAYVLSDCVA